MKLSSPAFRDGHRIPDVHVMRAIGGSNRSLPLAWSDVPAGTRSFALSVVDPHPVARNWVHWLVVNIPPDVTALPEGASGRAMPAGAVELRNGFGHVGYGGPQPPAGSGEHPYVCTVYALDVAKLNVPANASLARFRRALEGHVLAEAAITGKYGR